MSSVSVMPKKASVYAVDTPDTLEMLKAKNWLRQNPDMQGLSWRKAAKVAGVSDATLRRAKERL